MSDNFKFITVSMLLMLFFLLEYTWIPFEDVPIFYSVPFIYDGGPVRLDAWIYNACVKVEHILVVLIIHILTPFKKEGRILMIAFGLSFVEFFFTWNEPIGRIDLPFGMFVPVSTTLIKFSAVCYFMWGTVKRVFE